MASVYRMKLPVAQMLAVGAAVMTMTALAFFRVPILPAIGDDLHMSTTQLGLMTTVYAVGRLLMDVPAGIMVDSRPLVMILRLAGGLIALGSLLLAVAPVAAVAYLAIFTLGTGTALTNTTGAAYFSTIAPVARRGMSISGFAAFQLRGAVPRCSRSSSASWLWLVSRPCASCRHPSSDPRGKATTPPERGPSPA
jgi:predicted MFS family arabinose efflux permease